LGLIDRECLTPDVLDSADLFRAFRARGIRGQEDRADRGGTQQRTAIERLTIGRALDLLSHWRLLLRSLPEACSSIVSPACGQRRVSSPQYAAVSFAALL
jgi:hypothetical protein